MKLFKSFKVQWVGGVLLTIIGAVVIGYLLTDNGGQASEQPRATLELEDEPDLQAFEINVTTSGYSPSHIEIKAGILAKINFRLDSGTERMKQLISSEMGINALLSEGDNYFLIRDLAPGTYQYTNETGEFKGTITVIADKKISK
jgi:plastocyanin domain-containing protein